MITDRESRLFQDGLFAPDLNAYVPGTVYTCGGSTVSSRSVGLSLFDSYRFLVLHHNLTSHRKVNHANCEYDLLVLYD